MVDVSERIAEPPDIFVGRADDLDRTIDLLRKKTRLITLVGPPGCGKTRFAQRLGNLLRGQRGIGSKVRFVS